MFSEGFCVLKAVGNCIGLTSSATMCSKRQTFSKWAVLAPTIFLIFIAAFVSVLCTMAFLRQISFASIFDDTDLDMMGWVVWVGGPLSFFDMFGIDLMSHLVS